MENFSGSLTLAEAQSGIFLSSQEKAFCKGVAQGQPPAMVARSIGLKPRTKWMALLERSDVVETLAILKGQVDQFMNIEVTKDVLNSMLFEAHATADCSNAKIAAVRELGKMNGLYDPIKIESTNKVASKIEHLESLTDEELIKRAALRISLKNAEDAVLITDSNDGCSESE